MAYEMCIKMEQEDWQQEDSDPLCDPLDTANDQIKEEIKFDPGSPLKTVHDIQFAKCWIESEGANISDTETPVKSESEDDNEYRHEMQGFSASASKTLECAAKLNTLSTNIVNSRCMESLCRPCSVVLERLDSRTKASSVAVFSCPLCNNGFTSKFHRDRHQRLSCRRRRVNEPLKTILADEDTLAKKIPTAFQLSAKLNEPAPKSRKRLMCADCKYSTDNLGSFKRHLVTHTGEQGFPCTVCEYKATKKGNLTSHLLIHSDEKPFACAECNYRTVRKDSLTIHMRSHSGEKPFKCTQCDYASSYSYALTRHKRHKHAKDRPFGCIQCEYKCVSISTLARHMLRHRADKKLSCFHSSETLECAAKQNTLSTENTNSQSLESLCRPCCVVLERLDSRTNTSAAAVFSCPFCSIAFTSKFERDRHQRQSCRRRQFNQPLETTLASKDPGAKKIPAAFQLSAKLNELAPESRKRLMCADCKYSTDNLGTFNRHLVIHTGERRFPCTKCEYKATTKGSLTRHLLIHSDEKSFACTECNYRTVRKDSLTIHMRSHTGDKPFKCSQCDYASILSSELIRHMRKVHPKEHLSGYFQSAVFSCPFCNNGFTSKFQRDRHQRLSCRQRRFNEPLKTTLADEDTLAKKIPTAFQLSAKLNEPAPKSRKRLMCADCKYSTDNLSNFNRHLVTHTGERRFPCTKCEYKATTKGSLTRHLLIHSEVNLFACVVCNYRTVRKYSLTIHMRTHKGEKPFKCKQCNYRTVRKYSLTIHMLTHKGEKPFKCKQCNFASSNGSTLTWHMRDMHAKELPSGCIQSAIFSCPLCNIGFTSKYQLDRHQRLCCRRRSFNNPLKTTLADEDPRAKKIQTAFQLSAKLNEPAPTSRKRFTCADCNYSTDINSHFKDHLVRHSGERRFPCTVCVFKAATKSSLTRHLLIHSDEKSFACAVCNYRTVWKSNLTQHMRLHTWEKPFKCGQCDYASNYSTSLTRHKTHKHAKDRPFGCIHCEYTCVSITTLARHMLIHRAVKKLSCFHCKYETNYARDLKKHLAAKHIG